MSRLNPEGQHYANPSQVGELESRGDLCLCLGKAQGSGMTPVPITNITLGHSSSNGFLPHGGREAPHTSQSPCSAWSTQSVPE